MISKYRNMDFEEKQVKEEDISLYASNVYNKLLTYKGDIITQAKDSITGIDITTINATGDYQNELYVYCYIFFISLFITNVEPKRSNRK